MVRPTVASAAAGQPCGVRRLLLYFGLFLPKLQKRFFLHDTIGTPVFDVNALKCGKNPPQMSTYVPNAQNRHVFLWKMLCANIAGKH